MKKNSNTKKRKHVKKENERNIYSGAIMKKMVVFFCDFSVDNDDDDDKKKRAGRGSLRSNEQNKKVVSVVYLFVRI